MTISIGADHAGFEYKEKAKALIRSLGHTVNDLGTNSTESTDYPDYGYRVAEEVAGGTADLGLLVCGTGIGMAITANKVAGVRAANVESVLAATMAREHNNANVLAIGQRLMTWDVAKEIITAFLNASFLGGRHQRRVDKIHTLTNL